LSYICVKAGGLPIELGVQVSLKDMPKYKHSSLFVPSVNEEGKNFDGIDTCGQNYEAIFLHQ
jgi:hypothetical protein